MNGRKKEGRGEERKEGRKQGRKEGVKGKEMKAWRNEGRDEGMKTERKEVRKRGREKGRKERGKMEGKNDRRKEKTKKRSKEGTEGGTKSSPAEFDFLAGNFSGKKVNRKWGGGNHVFSVSISVNVLSLFFRCLQILLGHSWFLLFFLNCYSCLKSFYAPDGTKENKTSVLSSLLLLVLKSWVLLFVESKKRQKEVQ